MSAEAVAASSPPRVSGGRAQLLLLFGALLFGMMAVSTRAASEHHGASQIAFLRFASNLLLVLVVARLRPGSLSFTRPSLLFWRGFFGGTAVLLYFGAISRLGAGLGTLLNYIYPLWATLFAALFLKEPVGSRSGWGMLLATLGLAVVVGPGVIGDALSGLGEEWVRTGLLMGLVSSVLAGAATTIIRAARRTETALSVFGAFCLIGSLVCLPGALAEWSPVTQASFWPLLLASLSSFVAQLLFTYSLGFVSVGLGSLTTQLTVVASFALAAIFLGEPIGANVLLGGLMTSLGVMLTGMRTKSAPKNIPQSEDGLSESIPTAKQ